ncbi:MAG: amino acid adenylation domain-containing protein [Clostridia bacterium]|nr:amino acid adenylation domain-containing protein [Clostridia bacterium]
MQKKDVYNLTNPQKSIWYMENYYKGSTLNNIAGNLFIDEPINYDLFQKAINQFVKDNDGFRLKLFYDNEGEIKQYVSSFEPFDIEIVDLQNKTEVENLEKKMCNTPFSLINSNLFNFKIFRLPNGKGGFVLVAHHLIYDAYTASLVANKVINIYSSLLKGEESQELPTTYTNFINEEQKYINSNKYIKDKEYWNKQFEVVPEAGTIPGSKHEADNSCDALRKSFKLPQDLALKIKDYCFENKISSYNFFMGLYAVYISKVSNLDDFVIGTPILNRSNFSEKNTPGMFISTIPVHFSINSNQYFLDFSKTLATDFFTMFRHQKYSYQNVLDDIRKANPNQPNLYDIIISYQNAKTIKNKSDIPFEITWSFNNSISDSMQISLSDLNDEGILHIDYDYKLSKYTEKDICSIHNRILFMLEQILKNDSISIREIKVTTPQEEDLIVNKFNSTHLDYNKNKTVIDYFEEQVNKTPNSIALVCNKEALTYKELNEKANQLANHLIQNNVKPKDFVGIMVHRSCEMIIGILAILKAGATYLPIDPAYPKERITYMLQNSNCNTLLVCDDTIALIDGKYNKINISLNKDIYFTNKRENLNIKISPDDLIYMIYTSGSTGNPKGVMITHQNISNFILAEKQHIDFTPNKVMVSVTTICFDIFALELWCSLTSGMKLVLANDNEQMSPIALKELCEKYNVNMIQTTPSRFSILLFYNDDLSFLNNFSDIMVGGEAFPKSLLEKFQKNTNANIFNMYGPTETTVWSTIKNLTNSSVINIGKPLANTTCYILDNNKNLLPPFVPGELYIGGDGVSKGYWKRDDLTNKNFIKSPFDSDFIIYNTGDLAYFTDEGEIVHLGRTDFQVKIRGYRIELEEIENKIIKYPNISSCVVNAVQNSTKLCAYYIADNKINIADLRAYLSKLLPNYMVPNYFVKMDNFPYTPNGKINRKAFPLPEKAAPKEVLNKRNNIDSYVISQLEKILHINNISISDSIFDIGADSLTAIDLSTKISNKYNIDFSVKDVFENPIIKNISDTIATKSSNEHALEIKKASKKDKYFVSSAQRRIYYASTIAGKDSILYNMPGVICFNKKPDLKKLNKCFNELIKRHSSLRTYFIINDNDVYQKVSDKISFNLIEEVSDKTEDEVIKDFVKPFDLSKAPLFRAKLVILKEKVLLLFDMHHIISDGYSTSILSKELSKLYNNIMLSPLSVDYIDYAEWEFKQLNDNSLNNSKEYWVNKFKNTVPILNMPTDYSRPSTISYEGAKVYRTINSNLSKQITNLAKRQNVSTYILLLAVYYVLLEKYTSQEDIVVGTPSIGRNMQELSNIIGMFVNTLPLKNHINTSMKFSDFLETIKSSAIEALEHQNYPFDELINNLNLQRDNSRNPLFDTMFIYQNDGYSSLDFSGLEANVYIPDVNISKFDLSLEVIPTSDVFKLNFEYCTKLFCKDTIERFANHFINILHEIIDNVEITISDIDILSKDERNIILYEFNNTVKDYPKNKTIIDLFEAQAKKTPDNIAIVFEDEHLTFKELNEKSNMLAWHLKKRGLGRNDTVSIMINRSLELIVSILATLKCGSCYIPIDPNYPKDRVHYMLNNSNSKLLLTDTYLYDAIEFKDKLIVDLSNFAFDENKNNPPHINNPDDTSFIIYTSGSTGRPKGVVLSHGSFTNLIFHLNENVSFFGLKHPITIGSVTTVSFDIFTFETIISLQAGLKVAIANEDEQRLPTKFNTFIKNNNIKAIQMTPSRMKIFVDSIQDCPNLSNLDYVVLAGEPLPNLLLKELLKMGIKKVYNGYGPSETTVFSTFTDVTNYDVVNIGKPISNTQIYILDKTLSPVPIGTPGEIYISGAGVGKGYLNDEQKTKASFITNPFIPNSVMYKTGDVGKFLSNGEIAYLERLDNQVKIRGLRIELEEIENKLLELSNIKKVKVVKQSIQGRSFISAYYVTTSDITANDLRNFLSKSLPNYMVPSYFTRLEDFPYTPNGKIDKNALPLPDLAAEDSNIEYVKPKTEIEKKLVQILENLLKVKNIGILDNFFNLGGDSLITILLCTQIRQEFEVELSFKDVINNPIIRDLASIISNTRPKESDCSIPTCAKMDYYPISSAQKRIYLADKMLDNSTLYNISGNLLLESIPNIDKLQKALNTIVKRHEILRTYFDIVDGNIVQKIVEDLEVKIEVKRAETNDIVKLFNKYRSIFDLAKPPLFKVFLFELPSNKALLMLDIHHSIFDGASLNNLLSELSTLYNDKQLKDLPISYKDFAVWEQKQLSQNNFEDSKNFWIRQFKTDAPKLNLPTTYVRPEIKKYDGATFITYLSDDITKSIDNLSNQYNVTPYMLMLCAYYILIYKYSNQKDIVVGTPVSGRLYKELEPLLGAFINTLPLRIKFEESNTFEQLLEKVKYLCMDAFSHQEYPYDNLVNDLNVTRDTSRNPLFDTMFIYQNNGFTNIDFDNIRAQIYTHPSDTSKYDISLEVLPEEDELKLSFEYCTKLFDESFIKQFAKNYINIFNIVFLKPNIKIEDISILEIDNKNADDLQVIHPLNNSSSGNYSAPSNMLEIQIAEIYKKLLSVPNIGIDDNFFELGGDSLLAINLQIELLKHRINVTYPDIFMNPTIRELAQKISSNESHTFYNIDVNEMNKYNNILANTCNMPENIEKNPTGNILLTGATGFLGAHVLDSFLKNENGIAYCLIRPKKGISIEDKFLEKLHYYFGYKYDYYIGTRIILISSDITNNNFGLSTQDQNFLAKDINCIINCAAKVTHYGDYNSYKEVNVDAVEKLLTFALKYNKRFYQISTISVSGTTLEDSALSEHALNNIIFKENNFYIGQSLDNVYIRSKFEAEKLVLQYISKGLDAYILRVGNLMNRYEDGKFQPNVSQNAFVERLLAFANIGCIPEYLINNFLEFTPIDSCALAIIKLIQYSNANNRIFHLYNHHHIYVQDFVNILRKYMPFDVVSNETFINNIHNIMDQDNSSQMLSGIIRDFDNKQTLSFNSKIQIQSFFTVNYLIKTGFIWPDINNNYLTHFLDYFSSLGLLKRKEND